jgi:hypothetical protein
MGLMLRRRYVLIHWSVTSRIHHGIGSAGILVSITVVKLCTVSASRLRAAHCITTRSHAKTSTFQPQTAATTSLHPRDEPSCLSGSALSECSTAREIGGVSSAAPV